MFSARRLLPILLASSYGLAVTVSAHFHDHGHAPHGECCGPCGVPADAHGHDSDTKSPEKGPGGDSPADDQSCSVCKFLSNSPIAPEADDILFSSPLEQDLLLPAHEDPSQPIAPAWHSRGPPQVP
jgi:hypothetical protein